MSWRIVVISKRAKLDLQLGYMVVRSEEVTKIVLSEISTILIESTAVSITTSLIAELAKRKIKVIFCDEKKNPSCELVNYYGSHDTSNKVRKQIASDLMEPFRVLVDQEVYNMRLEQFEHEEKMLLVNILNKEIQIDGRIQYVNNAIKIYCKSIFDALNEDDSALIRFYKIEL